MPAARVDTAQAIRAQAQRLIAARGYAAVSMRDIAEAVGIRAGGLYNHFATKQDILRDLMQGHLEDLLRAWKAANPADAPPAERLTAFARFHIRFHFQKPEAVFIAYMELRNLSPENFEAIEMMRGAYEGELRSIIESGGDAFAVADAAVATRALIAMLTGVTTWYRPGGRLTIEAVERIYVDMARRSVGLAVPADGRGDGGRRRTCSTAE